MKMLCNNCGGQIRLSKTDNWMHNNKTKCQKIMPIESELYYQIRGIWTKDAILKKIMVDDRWLFRAIIAIYEKQTEDEKEIATTIHSNGIGFNGLDSPYLSSIAKKLLQKQKLTKTEIVRARYRMKKYVTQLENIVKERSVN